jgi:hypothetical protein
MLTIATDPKDLRGFRDFFITVRSQACSLAAACEGPPKTAWEEIVAKYDAVLAKLPKDADGNWTVASCLDSLFNTLISSNACASQFLPKKIKRVSPRGYWGFTTPPKEKCGLSQSGAFQTLFSRQLNNANNDIYGD